MSTNNPWTTPYQRSYQQIKAKLLENLRLRVPEITDYSEGNIFIIIISMFAAIAEVLHYYIDNMSRETFLVTARRFSSVHKHAQMVDYHIQAANPPTVDLTFYRNNNKMVEVEIIIPVNTAIKSNDGKPWLTTTTIIWPKDTYSVRVPVIQKKQAFVEDVDFGTVTEDDFIIELGELASGQLYVEGSMVLKLDGVTWRLVETFAYSNAYDQVYMVSIALNNKPIIVFGDGKFGMKPPTGSFITGNYFLTTGVAGNLPENSFTSNVPTIITDAQSDVSVTNTYAAAGGTNYEGFNQIKAHIPLSIKTLGVAITKDDYDAITRLVPGVGKTYVNYICGRFVEIYITPAGGGEASRALLESVAQRVSRSKVITTSVNIRPTHQVKIALNATINGNRSFNRIDIENQVKKALLEAYNPNTSDINKVVRMSDLYALIDNQSMVDFLSIDKLSFIPYPYPISVQSEVQPQLKLTNFNQEYFNETSSTKSESFMIEILSGTQYAVRTTTDIIASQDFGQPVTVTGNHCKFSLTIGTTDASYNVGDVYMINIQPMNKDITPHNYSLPIFEANNITLTINEVV